MASADAVQIRRLDPRDPAIMSDAFAAVGWRKPVEQYERYLREQRDGLRDVLVAVVDDEFAGYVTVSWRPTYRPLADAGIPEIQDVNVLPSFRRRGIATRLLDHAEGLIRGRCDAAGIGVGLHPGYAAAQRMYVLRGYVPDGHGVTVRDDVVREGQSVVVNDDLVLHLTKRLGRAISS